ncbi:hypothetical protein I6Y99_004367 [Vibrio parahaemolyticus]|nr:hypothetical protein [Vibrio parahaemolyticus]
MDNLIDDIARDTKERLKRKRLNETQARYTQRQRNMGRKRVNALITRQAHFFLRKLAIEGRLTNREVIELAVADQHGKRPLIPPVVKDIELAGYQGIYEWLNTDTVNILESLVSRKIYADVHKALTAIICAYYQSKTEI